MVCTYLQNDRYYAPLSALERRKVCFMGVGSLDNYSTSWETCVKALLAPERRVAK